jgi:hypothetical protein
VRVRLLELGRAHRPAAERAPEQQRPGAVVDGDDARLDGVADGDRDAALLVAQLLEVEPALGLAAEIHERAVLPDGDDHGADHVADVRIAAARAVGPGALVLGQHRREILVTVALGRHGRRSVEEACGAVQPAGAPRVRVRVRTGRDHRACSNVGARSRQPFGRGP